MEIYDHTFAILSHFLNVEFDFQSNIIGSFYSLRFSHE